MCRNALANRTISDTKILHDKKETGENKSEAAEIAGQIYYGKEKKKDSNEMSNKRQATQNVKHEHEETPATWKKECKKWNETTKSHTKWEEENKNLNKFVP